MHDSTWVRTNIPVNGVREILSLKNDGSVLEIGSGNGRNLVFLMRNGSFSKAVAIDNDPSAIQEMKKYADIEGIHVEIYQTDAISYLRSCADEFDVVVCDFVLPYLEVEKAVELIELMKSKTRRGGINHIAVYTDQRIRDRRDIKTIFGKWDLTHNLYKDWKILGDMSKYFFSAKLSTSNLSYEAMYMIAQKP